MTWTEYQKSYFESKWFMQQYKQQMFSHKMWNIIWIFFIYLSSKSQRNTSWKFTLKICFSQTINFFCCKINVWSTVHCIIHTEATTSKIWTNNINMNYFKCKTSLPFIDKQICCLHWAAESCSCHWWIID